MKSLMTSKETRIVRLIGVSFGCYLILSGNRVFMVDTSRRIFRRVIFRRLKQLGISRIDELVITHAHFDHAENAAWLKENYECRILIHHSEADLLASGRNAPIRGAVFLTKPMTVLFAKQIGNMLFYDPVRPDMKIPDTGYNLLPDSQNIRIMHTPGHTEGSLSVAVDDEICIAGDNLVGFIPGMIFPHFAQDAEAVYRSWKKMLETNCSLFLPSHGFSIKRKHLCRNI